MDREALLARIIQNPRLPTPPALALQVLEKASRPQCTIAEIGQIISRDPSLCSRILKIINSALFGLPRAVTSIERALNLLGLRRVRSLVLSLSLPAMQGNTSLNPRLRDYWKISVASAIVAREMAVLKKSPDPDTEMVAGLLCDLGVLVLQNLFPEQYLQVLAYPPEILAGNQCRVEEKILGLNHADVSAVLLKNWRLPDDLTEAIRYHHQPAVAPAPCAERAHLLYFADRIAQLQLTVDKAVLLGEIVSMAKNRYGLDDHEFQIFIQPLSEKIEEFAALLQINIGVSHYPTLFAQATENLTRLAVETSLDNFRFQKEKHNAEKQLKVAEETLHQTEEKLRQAMKMEAIGRLAGGVAHDFNNLLTVMSGYSELLLKTLPAQDQHRPYVEEIKKAGEKAHDLTRQLLAFSRKQVLIPRVVNLNTIVRAMENMLRRLIGEHIQLVTDLDATLPNVKVDPGQMDQVIMNLVINAKDAMPLGGKLTVATSKIDIQELQDGLKPGTYAILRLEDTGCGIPESVRTQIFEPFFTTKDKGKGSGLGLATVHGIVKQSGGHITVESQPDQGTSFHIFLPSVTEISEEISPPPSPANIPKGTETILVAEDEDAVRKFARRTLENFGYKVLEASNGLEALAVSEEHQGTIHLLMTDTIMPHLGGRELAFRLVKIHPQLKVLYTSGYTDEEIINQGIPTTGIPFLQKPFTPDALAGKVFEILHNRYSRLQTQLDNTSG